ncbi:AMP-binding protein [Streptomyces sp. MS1.HAVA.3]|uniref:AMP-binding protein n=1 Tax=Streptomyces caledonius TaxID=3134107 RepID=A0ABU8U279_9ACTN
MDAHNVPRRDLLIHDLLDATVSRAAHSAAVRDAGGVWDYHELDRFSHGVEAWLDTHAVGPGDRVVVQLPTNRALVALFFGVSRRGAVFVPLNPAMKPFHLASVLANAEPRLVVAADEAVGAVREAAGAAAPYPVHGFEEAWAEIDALTRTGVRARPSAARPDDIAVLIYTSGSTAAPKGVVGPHGAVTFATGALTTALGYRDDDIVFCRFPMSWDYGLYKVLMTTLVGCEIVLESGDSDLVLLRRMHEVGATVVPLVPSFATMIAALARRSPEHMAPVRLFTNTGAALPQTTIDALRGLFPGARVVRQFGQTECKRISVMPPEEDHERPDSVGLPLPGTRVLILDEDGNEVPVGETGEIVAVGPHVMPGYWRAPELSARAFRHDPRTGEPRLHTGDYGHLDADGYLYFEGRRDDMFKRKGIRMSTLEIEAAAMDIPGVRAAGAVPPSGTRDLAIVVESDMEPRAVLKELAQRLEPQKVPALCHTVDSFPLTAHGKNATQQLVLLLEGAAR